MNFELSKTCQLSTVMCQIDALNPGGVTLEFFWDHACSKNRGKGGTFEVKTRTAFSGKRGVISDRVPRFPYLGVFFISLYFRV